MTPHSQFFQNCVIILFKFIGLQKNSQGTF